MPVGNGNSDAARMWLNADLYVADYGTPGPDDTTTALTGLGFDLVGLISEDDGITQTYSSDDSDKFAYGSILVRRTSVKEKVQFGATAWEDTDLVWKLANPGSDTEDAGGGVTKRTRRSRNIGLAIKAVCLELADGDVTKRLFIPKGQILRTGDAPIKDNEIAGYPLTIDSLAASDGEGGTYFYYELTDDPEAAPAGS